MREVVVFTGHRDVDPSHADLIQLKTVLAVKDADEFVFGGAIGADILAFKAAWQARMAERQACHLSEEQYQALLRGEGSFPRRLANLNIVCTVADTLNEQPWDARRALEWHKISPPDIEFVELHLPYTAQSLKHRNHVMIDRIMATGCGGYVLAYWRDGEYRSGTWSAISYAKKHGIEVRNILG